MEDLFTVSISNIKEFLEKSIHFLVVIENGKKIKEKIDKILNKLQNMFK